MVLKDQSEYGGVDGPIQPRSKGHVDLTAQEQRMVLARTMAAEKGGKMKDYKETRNDDGTITIEVTPYDEEQAQRELGWIDR